MAREVSGCDGGGEMTDSDVPKRRPRKLRWLWWFAGTVAVVLGAVSLSSISRIASQHGRFVEVCAALDAGSDAFTTRDALTKSLGDPDVVRHRSRGYEFVWTVDHKPNRDGLTMLVLWVGFDSHDRMVAHDWYRMDRDWRDTIRYGTVQNQMRKTVEGTTSQYAPSE